MVRARVVLGLGSGFLLAVHLGIYRWMIKHLNVSQAAGTDAWGCQQCSREEAWQPSTSAVHP